MSTSFSLTSEIIELDGAVNSSSDSVHDEQPTRRSRQPTHRRMSSVSSFVLFKAPRVDEAENSDASRTDLQQATRLALQAFPPLLISVGGLVAAGWMMDVFQHWDVFVHVSELFILVPVLLNLKGNLEMNLAARLSTSANMGDLDQVATRNPLVLGNLALIQVQALVTGAVAGMFSFVLGMMEHPSEPATVSDSILIVVCSMISATVSSFVLGVFMCALIILSRILYIDPDNIACPMASSLGDVVTLGILAASSHVLLSWMDTMLGSSLFLLMAISLPFFGRAVWRNTYVKDLLYTGWSPIILAMLISSFAGLLLERFVRQYQGLAMLTPILCGLCGNLGSIYASRISTSLHSGAKEAYRRVEWTLLLMNIPVQLLFMFLIWVLDLGHLEFSLEFGLTYFVVAMLCTYVALKIGKALTLAFWKRGYDPDNYVLPYLTAIVDVICTSSLVISFTFLSRNASPLLPKQL